MRGKAPKKRYRIPRRIAENRHRLRHMGSKNSNWKGRSNEYPIVFGILLLVFSIGACHLSSPVSSRSFRAFFRKSTG
jgi:hypothetical protein